MEEKPKIIVTRSRGTKAPAKNFAFTAGMVPTSGVLADYHQKAWKIFNGLPMPTVADEAWRRTNLAELPADSVHLPSEGAFRELASVPTDLLQPLTADKHGGQVVVLPGGANLSLTPELIRKGIIFTDLHTAERDHPELVARMIGQTVSPEDGKFAALVGALAQNGVVLYVPKDVIVEQPLNSLLWGPGGDMAYLGLGG
jgi:Fe-S cluster assembly protein SufD